MTLNRAATTSLINALQDPEIEVRDAAMESLHGKKIAIKRLVALFNSSWS
jgi:hypothetical protein